MVNTIDKGCQYGDVTPDGSAVVCGGTHSKSSTDRTTSVTLLDASTLKILSSSRVGQGGFEGIAILPNKSAVILGTRNATFFSKLHHLPQQSLWIPSTGAIKVKDLSLKIDRIEVVHPKMTAYYSSNAKGIEVWNAEDLVSGSVKSFILLPKIPANSWIKPFSSIDKLEISNDGKFLVAIAKSNHEGPSDPRRVYVWDTRSEELVYTINADTFALSQDGKTLVTSHHLRDTSRLDLLENQRTVKMWGLTNGKLIGKVQVPKEQEGIVSLAVSSDRRFIAYGRTYLPGPMMPFSRSTSGVGVIDLKTGQRVFSQNTSAPFLAFINNDRTLLAGGDSIKFFAIQ